MSRPDQAVVRQIFLRAKAEVDKTLAEYGATKEHLEVRHLEKLDAIMDATSLKEAEELAQKATLSVFTTVLVLLSRGKILGRNPTAAYEKKARKAESRARMFDKKAESKFSDAGEVERFRKNAEKERAKALEFWQKAGIEPPKPEELVLTDEELAEAEEEVKKVATKKSVVAKASKKGRKK